MIMVEKLKDKKEKLLRQKNQFEANLHAISGALQLIEELLKEELEQEEVEENGRD